MSIKPVRSFILITFIIICLLPSNAWAAEAKSGSLSTHEIKTRLPSSNYLPVGNGFFMNYRSTQDTYLVENNDGFTILQYSNNKIYAERYNKQFKRTAYYEIPLELTLFGGFHKGRDGYYYIVFGDNNQKESLGKEVMRVVKYTAGFKRLASLSLTVEDISKRYGCTTPFYAGCTRIDDKDGEMVIHTSRLMFRSSDGLRHQSNMTVRVDIDNMKLLENVDPYVSHSFDQYVKFDNDTMVFMDHGDAYPRSFVLHTARYEPSWYSEGVFFSYKNIDLLRINGETGNNYTGASAGGFEISGSNYIMAANSINQELFPKDQIRNIILCVVSRNNPSSGDVKRIWITKFSASSELKAGAQFAGIPQLVKISANKFLLIWEEFIGVKEKNSSYISRQYTNTKYVFIDGGGKRISATTSIKGVRLADNVEPLYSDGKVMWVAPGREKQGIYLHVLDVN